MKIKNWNQFRWITKENTFDQWAKGSREVASEGPTVLLTILLLIWHFQVVARRTSPEMTTAFHESLHGRFIEIQKNLGRKKLYKTIYTVKPQSNLEGENNSSILKLQHSRAGPYQMRDHSESRKEYYQNRQQTTSRRSLIHSRKSVGPRTEPWQTPALTGYSCEE